MNKKRRDSTQPAQQPQHTQGTRWPGLAILAAVALLIAAVLILKDRPAGPPAIAQSGPQATATLPGELPEAQLDRLLAAGQPALAFFHSKNCIQCIQMMEVVEEVYPEFEKSVALVDVDVYDETNRNLLQRAKIRGIPTQTASGLRTVGGCL